VSGWGVPPIDQCVIAVGSMEDSRPEVYRLPAGGEAGVDGEDGLD